MFPLLKFLELILWSYIFLGAVFLLCARGRRIDSLLFICVREWRAEEVQLWLDVSGLHPEFVVHGVRRPPLYRNCGNVHVVDGSWFIS